MLEHSDRVSILRDGDGEFISTVNAVDVTADELKHMMVGRELNNHYYRVDYGEPVSDEIVLSVEHVSVRGRWKM